jgi:glycerophosphoryl diester phosphodiesterase
MHDFVLIAHRGFSSKAPENTLAAFDLALEQGFTNIELDVQLTSDGELVIIHDSAVDRTTNGTGTVRSFWFNARFAKERIPTLRRVLERYAGKIHLHLELKSDEPDLAAKVAEALEICGWTAGLNSKPFTMPGLTITSAKIEQVERSLRLLPTIPHHWLAWELNEEVIETALDKGFAGICISPAAADSSLVKQAQAKGLTVRGLGVKTDDDIRTLIAAGAEGTTTNWPDRGLQIKEELSV